MAIDTTTPRSRRAVMAGAFGGVLASLGLLAKAPEVRAGTDGDLVVDDTSTGLATTELVATDSDPALKVTGGGTGIEAIGARGILGTSSAGVGVLGASAVADNSIPAAINASTGVYGISLAGVGVYGASDTGHGIYAANNSSSKAAIVAEGDPGTAIHGHAGPGPVPTSPASTAVFASAAGSRQGIHSWVENGIALQALSTGSIAILASGDADGIAGASSGDGTGVVGWSTSTTPPAVPAAGPPKTGVYGEATQDSSARGVFGKTTIGQGVRGEATSGVGVEAVATTGAALDVSGRAVFSRSGRVSVVAKATYVDVTVPGGLSGSPLVLAVLQLYRPGVWVTAARPNWPSAGVVRIYLNAVASTTVATPLAWFVLG